MQKLKEWLSLNFPNRICQSCICYQDILFFSIARLWVFHHLAGQHLNSCYDNGIKNVMKLPLQALSMVYWSVSSVESPSILKRNRHEPILSPQTSRLASVSAGFMHELNSEYYFIHHGQRSRLTHFYLWDCH